MRCTKIRCPIQHGQVKEPCTQTDCPYRTEPATNADHIRAMSDEELRDFLWTVEFLGIEAIIPICCDKPCSDPESGNPGVDACKQCLLEKLQQPCEGSPTVDAVEVVRCRDCKHYHPEEGWCDEHSHFLKHDGEFCHPWESSDRKMFPEDYYCADGERRCE